MLSSDRHLAVFEHVPDHDATNGDIAAQVGADLGIPPDPDQRAVLDAIYAYRRSAPRRPACFDIATICSRQNIKTSTYEIAALTDLFVFMEPLHIWTAHLFKTAKSTFKHMVDLVESNDEYRRKCRRPRTATGDEAIVLLSGEEIQFHARSRGGGRGLTARKVTLDEALFLGEMDMGALLPTLATVEGAQVRYASSAGMVTSAVLRDLRDRGRSGEDPGLAYFEWTAERRPCAASYCSHAVGTAGCALDDVELWRQSNPAIDRRITVETLANLRRSMPPAEFAREFLGWWDDPPASDAGPFDLEQWLGMADPNAPRGDSAVFGVDVTTDRLAHVAAAWRRDDGRVQVMLTDTGLSPLAAPGRLTHLATSWKGPVMLGGTSAALTDVPRSTAVSAGEFASACGRFDDLFRERRIRHGNQPELNDAIRSARWRSVGNAGERALQLRDSPSVGPLAAVVRALHGLLGIPKPPPAPPLVEKVRATVDERDVATMEF